MKPIDLKIEILGYGPKLKIDETRELDSQGVIAMASRMTYKSGSAKDIALDAVNNLKEEIPNVATIAEENNFVKLKAVESLVHFSPLFSALTISLLSKRG